MSGIWDHDDSAELRDRAIGAAWEAILEGIAEVHRLSDPDPDQGPEDVLEEILDAVREQAIDRFHLDTPKPTPPTIEGTHR